MYSTVVRSMRRTLRSKLLISRKSVNVFLHMHVQRECSAEQTLYAQHPVSLRAYLPGSCPRFFIAMQIQYSCEHTFVQQYYYALCAEPCVLNCLLGEREGLSTYIYNGNTQQNPLCAESCVIISHLSPFLACVFSSRCNFTTLTSTPLYSRRLYTQKTLCSKVFIKRA